MADTGIVPTIVQDGQVYLASSSATPNSQSWTFYSFARLTAASFSGEQNGAQPNFGASGGPIQFGFLSSTRGGGGGQWGLDNFSVTASNGQPAQAIWPVEPVPLTNAAIGSITSAGAGSPFTALAASFTDANAGATVGTESATITWGDGTTSAGTITSNGGGNFSINATHIYATDVPRNVVVTIVDSLGAATSVGASYTGGLQLDRQGHLLNFYETSSGTSSTEVDSGINATSPSPYVVDQQDPSPTVFDIHAGNLLYAVGQPNSIDSDVQSILVGPDGTLYDLHQPTGSPSAGGARMRSRPVRATF